MLAKPNQIAQAEHPPSMNALQQMHRCDKDLGNVPSGFQVNILPDMDWLAVAGGQCVSNFAGSPGTVSPTLLIRFCYMPCSFPDSSNFIIEN